MSESLLSTDQRCFVCGTTSNLHRHHIYAGSRRKNSEKYGCWVYLCASHHNMSTSGVHSNRELDISIKRECQKKMEEKIGREEFIRLFGKSYL